MEVRDYTGFDATGLRELIEKGDVTADEVRTAAMAALEEVQPRLNALGGATIRASRSPAPPMDLSPVFRS